MKLKLILVAFLICSIIITRAQTSSNVTAPNDTTKAKDSAKVVATENKDNEVQNRANKSTDDKEKVGTLCLRNLSVTVYNNVGKTADILVVDSVTLSISNGYIISIVVKCGDVSFTNTKAPITVKEKRFTDIDKLQNTRNKVEGKTEFIYFTDVIAYPPDLKSYISDDEVDVVFTKTNKCLTLRKSVGVNNVLDARVYTDALSAFGKEANGLIQTDLKFYQILNRSNWLNNGLIPLNYFKLNVTASKFDSKRGFEDSATFSRTSLYQKSKIAAEVAFNAATLWIELKSLSRVYLDLGYGVNVGSVALTKDTVTINTRNKFIEFGLNVKISSNIGCELFARRIWQTSKSTDEKLLGVDSVNHIRQDDIRSYYRVGGEVFWNPFQDKGSRIYGRLNYVFTDQDVDKKNDFIQLQLGYSILINSLFNKSK